MTTGAQPTGKELDEALVRAIRQLIAEAIETDEAGEAITAAR
jgi:hypothetical protein